jgi:AraC-like DNA-binding protein
MVLGSPSQLGKLQELSTPVKVLRKCVYLSARWGTSTEPSDNSLAFTETDVVHYPPMTDRRRHDWSDVRSHIHARMAELRLSVVDLARASGLSEKHVRTLLNDGPEQSLPRDQTRWALCDALRWTPDSIDRILDGDEPLEAEDASGEVRRLDQIDGRLAEMEALASANLASIRAQTDEMARFWRQFQQLKDDVRAVETALTQLRQAPDQGEPGQP